MSPERWRRIEEVYQAALDKPSGQRAVFLADAAGDDTGLRQEVEALIRRTESLRSPLDQPVWQMPETEELPANQQVGPYQILERIGTGGMGRVYKALDTRLGRTVALKISKSQFSDRCQREARAISALNHPNICTLFDLGPDYLVMEYVEGQPLQGPLPVDQALTIGVAIAGALDAAHRQGIVHRDLKPANILLAKSGPKLLDFGLARQTRLPEEDITREGTIAGTLAYMAPEQLQGRQADARSDIFSFGVLLYELLTGRKAFQADDSASLIAAILTAQPGPIREALPQASPALERALDRCLAKDPDERWQSARDLKAELEWIAKGPAADAAPAPPRRIPRRTVWMTAAAGAILAALAGWGWLREGQQPAPLIRFTVDPPPGELIVRSFPLVSPDGQRIVFASRSSENADATARIHRISTGESTSLGASGVPMAWSPDSTAIALIGKEGLTRVDLATGAQSEIARGPVSTFGWGPDNSYLLTIPKQGMFWGTGGRRTLLQNADANRATGPFLPGGKSYLLWVIRGNTVETWQAWLDRRPPKRLVSQLALYAPPGYLLYVQAHILMAQRFDARRGEIGGDPQVLASSVAHSDSPGPQYGLLSVSQNGVLAYLRDAPRPAMRLIWYDRAGNATSTVGDAGEYSNPALSPDGQRLAVCIREADGRRDIWVIDLERGGRTRLTFAGSDNADPTWSADGSAIVYSANRHGHRDLYTRASAGTGEERLLLDTGKDINPLDWSPDGKVLIFNSSNPNTIRELKTLPMGSGPRVPAPFLASPFRMDWASFSPDGRWVLYHSMENGRAEVFMQPFPPDGRKWPISSGVSAEAHWRGDGREIFYTSNSAMMGLEIRVAGSQVSFGKPRELFRVPPLRDFGRNSFTVSRDGLRFLLVTTQPEAQPPIMVVSNWPRLLEGPSPNR